MSSTSAGAASADDWSSSWGADASNSDGWGADAGDDEFEPIEPDRNVASASSYNWDSHDKTAAASAAGNREEEADFFSSLSVQDKVQYSSRAASYFI